MARTSSRGFTLTELAVTCLVIGIVVAFSVGGFRSLALSQNLQGAKENVAAQLRMARAKAVATNTPQPVHFVGVNVYHIHYPTGIMNGTNWTLPAGISFGRAMSDWYTIGSDGRVTMSGGADGVIPFVDRRGHRDSIFVESSGTILIK